MSGARLRPSVRADPWAFALSTYGKLGRPMVRLQPPDLERVRRHCGKVMARP